ncbi:MAG: hypothetical protein S4CHLAM6_09980 [Chlamydiae bacterium]|nr:hypothetical protein [Chlamydiota bacterium]
MQRQAPQRPLASNENFYATHNISIVAQSHLNKPINVEHAKQVCKHLQAYHPFMRTAIVKENNQYFFRETPQMKIKIQVEENSYCSSIENFINATLDLSSPFEILVIKSKNGDILVTRTHHSMSDGISIQAFHNDFLISLERLLEQKELEQREPYPTPKPTSEYFPQHLTPKSKAQLKKELKTDLSLLNIKNLPMQSDQNDKPKIHIKNIRIKRPQLSQLLTLCKEKKVKVNSLICAALLIVSGSFIECESDDFQLLLDIPVNLRPFINPKIPNNYLATIVSGYSHYYNANPSQDVWHLAREIDYDFHEKFDLETMLKKLLVFDQLYDNSEPKIELYTSNIGRVHFETQHYNVEEFGFYACGQIPLIFTASSTSDVMRFSFLYTTPFNSHKLVEKLSEKYLDLLNNLN